MIIRFNVKESFETVMTSLTTSNESWKVVKIDSVEDTWYLEDLYFPESSARISVNRYGGVTIKTAWSDFIYSINEEDDGCSVVYEGAYMGLLSQNLIPKLTPINLLESEVKSSLTGWTTLDKYIESREIFHSFKKENEMYINNFIHPKVVNELVKG